MYDLRALKLKRARLRKLRTKYYADPLKNERLIFSLETRIEKLNQEIAMLDLDNPRLKPRIALGEL